MLKCTVQWTPPDSNWIVSYIFILRCPVHWTPLDSRWTVSYIFIEMLKCTVHWTPLDSTGLRICELKSRDRLSSSLDSTGLQVDCVIYIYRDVEVCSPLDSTGLQLDCVIYIYRDVKVCSPLDCIMYIHTVRYIQPEWITQSYSMFEYTQLDSEELGYIINSITYRTKYCLVRQMHMYITLTAFIFCTSTTLIFTFNITILITFTAITSSTSSTGINTFTVLILTLITGVLIFMI